MRLLDWRNPLWRKRFWAVLTVVVIAFLATNPEFRLLVPVLDAIGLDIFVLLIEVQFIALLSGAFGPLLRFFWPVLLPLIRTIDGASSSLAALRFTRDFVRYGVFHWAGELGPHAWLRLHKLLRAARIGASQSFKRNRAPDAGMLRTL
jgi:hypothetical protein